MNELPRPLEQMKEEARRDDWYELFVGSDIRQLIGTIERRDTELARLQAIVDRLPKTANGVPRVPGDEVWVRADEMLSSVFDVVGAKTSTKWVVRWNDDLGDNGEYDAAFIRDGYGIVDSCKSVDECYSTRYDADAAEAADAAKETEA